MEKRLKSRWGRRFLGKLEGFKDKEERKFERAHLKAYLKGRPTFKYGFHLNKDGDKIPDLHFVREELIDLREKSRTINEKVGNE